MESGVKLFGYVSENFELLRREGEYQHLRNTD